MDPKRALAEIRTCLEAERYAVKPHFTQRMDERGLFWSDVQAVVDAPTGICSDGHDDFGRARWILTGTATDGLELEIVCTLDQDENGNTVVFITIYWGK